MSNSLRAHAWLSALAFTGASLVFHAGFGDSIREPKWIWVWVAGLFQLLAALAFSQWKKGKEAPLYLWAFFVFCLFQPLFFNSYLRVLPFLFSVSSVFVLSLFFVESKVFYRALGLTTLLQLIWMFLQFFGLDPLFVQKKIFEFEHPLVGFLGQETTLGAWLAPVAWIWFARRNWWLAGICTLGVFATLSAFSILAWLGGLAAYLFWRRPKLGLALMGCLALLAFGGWIFGQGFFYDNGRLNAWRMLVWAWLERPWFGYGLDSFAREFRYHQGFSGPVWAQAHSEPLELLFGGGVIGFMLASGLFLQLWLRKECWWGKEEMLPWYLALTVILANSLGNFPLHIAPTALLAGIAYFQLVREKRAAESPRY